MCPALIYATNTSSQTTTIAGTTVSFSNLTRRCGKIALSGGNVDLNAKGYYKVLVNLTIAGTVAGTATINILKDGVPVVAATATVVTSADSVDSICIPCEVHQDCPCSGIITVVVSGAITNITNASILVNKDADL